MTASTDGNQRRRLSRPLAWVLALSIAIGPILAAQSAAARAASAETPSTGPQPTEHHANTMNAAKATVLGVVEGLTEYLPVSSTGHLMVAQRAMDVGQTDADRAAADSYTVVIQFGAIIAVLVIYWKRVSTMLLGVVGKDRQGRDLLVRLIVAFLPAALVAVLLEAPIKEYLFGAWPVVAAWIVGGGAILALHHRGWDTARGGDDLASLSTRGALTIGLAQILALWPGTSRSLVTLLAGLGVGLSMAAAVEFTFLLGLATLGAASIYETAKNGSQVIDTFGLATPMIGVLVAFVSALVAVKWMVDYLQRHDLTLFGWYRIGAGVLAGSLLLAGVI